MKTAKVIAIVQRKEVSLTSGTMIMKTRKPSMVHLLAQCNQGHPSTILLAKKGKQ